MLDYSDFLSVLPQAKQYDRYITGLCPFHDDKSPSLLVFKDGWWQCLGCGKHGTWKTLWNKLKGQPVQVMPERQTAWGKPNLKGEDLEEVCFQSHEDLLRFPSLGWYLEMRGIQDRIEPNLLGYWDGWYTIPVFSREGYFQTAVFRSAPHVQKVIDVRYWSTGSPALYVPDWKLVDRSGVMFVVFGMVDALVLSDLRLPVATPTAGQASLKPEWLDSFRKPIIIVPDQGEEKEASKLASALGWRGRVLRLSYPDGIKDPAGFAEVGKKKELLSLLAKEA